MNLCPDIDGVPRWIDALSAVCPHGFMPYVSALRSLYFNAVFNRRDLPNAPLQLRALLPHQWRAVSCKRLGPWPECRGLNRFGVNAVIWFGLIRSMPVEKQESARRRPRGDQRSQNVFMVAGLFKLACLRLPPQIALICFYALMPLRPSALSPY